MIEHTHVERLERAQLSLEGLSVGDAFGQSFFFVTPVTADARLEERTIPPPPWFYTDDTVMALSVFRSLKIHQGIHGEWLAAAFAEEYRREPDRGYGGTARGILQAIGEGVSWEQAAGRVFDGEGSCGNGGAMRAGPIGAYFADDINQLVAAAKASAEVTHAHPDGQTGAIAVALATAWMVNHYQPSQSRSHRMIEFVLEHLPQTETFWRLKKALALPLEMSPKTAASILGNGSEVISSDTVPLCLWLACRHSDDFCEALWSAVSVDGDRTRLAQLSEAWLPSVLEGPASLTNGCNPERVFLSNTMTPERATRCSKFLSLVLRHQPDKVSIRLDEAGWVAVDDLLTGCALARHPLTREQLNDIVTTNPKKRFEFSEDGFRIRASQGHSVEVDLQYAPQVPPELLYHGTASRFLDGIRAGGLLKMQRHHVHLSAETKMTLEVGARRGKPVLLTILAGEMHRAGFIFHRSTNGVWLVEQVPPEYILFPI